MKRQLKQALMTTTGAFAIVIAAQPTLAADIPTKAPAYKASVAAPMFDWSGFYIGLNAGYGWADTGWTFPVDNFYGPAGFNFETNSDGFLFGLHAGYNWQTAPNQVIGFDASWNWGNSHDTVTGPVAVFPLDDHYTKVRDLALVTARAGVIVNTSLWYVKGGYAAGKVRLSSLSGEPVAGVTWSDSKYLHGWTVGAGVEVAAWGPNTTFGIEYNYANLNGKNFGGTLSNGESTSVDLSDVKIHTLLARLSYKFATGKAPIMARY